MSKSNQKIRAVSVGCGPRAGTHMAAMQGCGAIDLVAACDLDEARLKAAGKQFKIPRLYRDMSEMIQKEKADLVDIVTPPTIRVGIVETAMAAGAKNILIEKPIALKPSESRRLAELGKKTFIAVNTQYQWMPHWQRFWKMIENGELGELRTIRCSTKTNILEQGPHVFDLSMKAARLSGLHKPDWVLAAATGVERFGDIPVPADTAATVGIGEARLFWNQGPSAPTVPGEESPWLHIQVEIIGSKGRLWVSLNRGYELWRDGKHESGPTLWANDDGSSQSGLFVELRDRITNGTTNEFPTRMEIAAPNNDVMFACYASALGGGRVNLPIHLPDSVITEVEKLAHTRSFS